MLAGGETQQLRAQGGIPTGIRRHIDSLERHSTANGLGSDGLVSPSRELLPATKGSAFTVPAVESRPYAGADLSFLLRPPERLPLSHEIAECFDPFVGGRLFAPYIQDIHTVTGIQPDNHMHSVITAIRSNSVIRGSVNPEGLSWWKLIVVLSHSALKLTPSSGAGRC